MMRQPKTEDQIVTELLAKGVRNERGCLISHLKPNAKGYIPVQVGGRSGMKWRGHRLVFKVIKGYVDPDLMVLHSCDTRNCIEIEHLFEGTAKENTQDMMKKGRNKYIIPDNTKVNGDLIRELADQGLTGREIAARFNVSPSTISNYLSGVYKDV